MSKLQKGFIYDHLLKDISGNLVFDVGANVGNTTRKFLDAGAEVVAIEPQVELTKSDNFLGVLGIENVCLSDKVDVVDFYKCSSPNKSSCNFDWRKLSPSVKWEEQRIETTTLDKLIEKYGIPTYIKIDVEGYEDKVLEGLSYKIKYITFEYTPEFRDQFVRCLDKINELGFSKLIAGEKKKRSFLVDEFSSIDEAIKYFDALPNGTQGDLEVINE